MLGKNFCAAVYLSGHVSQDIKEILIKSTASQIPFTNPDSFAALRTMIYSRVHPSINIEPCFPIIAPR